MDVEHNNFLLLLFFFFFFFFFFFDRCLAIDSVGTSSRFLKEKSTQPDSVLFGL